MAFPFLRVQPFPQGVCTTFYKTGKMIPENVWQDVLKNVSRIEKSLEKKFGDQTTPCW